MSIISIASTAILLLGILQIFLLIYNRKNIIATKYMYLSLMATIYFSIDNILVDIIYGNNIINIFMVRTVYVLGMVLPYYLSYFINYYVDQNYRVPLWHKLFIAIFSILIVFTPYILGYTYTYTNIIPGKLYNGYRLIVLVLLVYILKNILLVRLMAKLHPRLSAIYRYFRVVFVQITTIIIINLLLNNNSGLIIYIPSWGILVVWGYKVLFGQSYFAFNKNLIKKAIYLIFLYIIIAIIIATIILGVVLLTRSINISSGINAIIYTALTIIISFSLIPLRSIFDKMSVRIFYRNTYNPQDLAKQASNALSSSIDLDQISHSILTLLMDSFKLDHIGLLVLNPTSNSSDLTTANSIPKTKTINLATSTTIKTKSQDISQSKTSTPQDIKHQDTTSRNTTTQDVTPHNSSQDSIPQTSTTKTSNPHSTSKTPKATPNHLSIYRSYYYPLESSLTLPSKVLFSHLDTNIVVVDELPENMNKYELTSRNIGLMVNLKNSLNQPIAILILGYKKSGDIYTNSDLSALKLITNELSLALYNAQNLSELKDLNINLQDKVDDATKALRRSNKRLLDLDKAKDEFLSIASHQLRTPITTIKGYLSMIMEGDYGRVSSSQDPIIKQLSSISDQMSSLISDILNVSRISQNKFIVTKTPTNLKDLITKQLDKLAHLAHQKNITFSTHLTPTTTLDLDQEKMAQVISNLVDNAIHYSIPNSTISIKLEKASNSLDSSYYPDLEPLDYPSPKHSPNYKNNHPSSKQHLNPSTKQSLSTTTYRFLVTDTGIGVPKKEQAKLFTKFYRATNATTIRPDGTGLGLFLVRKVIEAHHGNLIFNSKASNASLSPSLDNEPNSNKTHHPTGSTFGFEV